MNLEGTLTLFIFSCISLVIYFIPATIASHRKHRERTPIFLMNLLLGCSLIFWIVALIWAFSSNVERESDR